MHWACSKTPRESRSQSLLVYPAVTHHFNDEIRLRLTFSSDMARVYTAELAPGRQRSFGER